MTCKECIHYDVCEALESNGISKVYPSQCGCYKPKSRFVELPCEVGQKVFFYTCVCDKAGEEKYDILDGEVISFSLNNRGFWVYCRYECGLTYWHKDEDIGKTVFLTKEEAEKALEERNKK